MLLVLPAAASGHAQLQDTVPDRAETAKTPPREVALRFNEAVEASFGAIRVFDSAGKRVDSGEAFHPGGRAAELAVRVKPRLADGVYTATYRVISADSHPISSGFVFQLGDSANAGGAAKSVDELLTGSEAGPVTEVAFGAARAIQYAAIALVVGGLAFAFLVWLPALRAAAGAAPAWPEAAGSFARRLRRFILGGAAAGAAATLAGIAAQAATASGSSVWKALDPTVLGDVLATRFGLLWAITLAAWVAIGALGAMVLHPRGARSPVLRPAELGATGVAAPGPSPALLAALAVPAAFLVLLPALAGHAAAQSPTWLLVPANAAHVAAMALWLGGLAVLLLALPAATRRLGKADRARLLAAALTRFSPLALIAVLTLAVTGVIQSLVYVETLTNLLDTPFGRAVAIKALLLIALAGIGLWHRRRSLPALRRIAGAGEPAGHAGVLVRRALRFEVVLVVVVLGVTGALASYPPSTAATGPVSESARIGPDKLDLTADPATTGPNELHLYVTDPRTGRQVDTAKEVRVTAALPEEDIAGLRQTVTKAGPGHYVVRGATLGVAGDWQITTQVRVSDFDQYQTTMEVPIR